MSLKERQRRYQKKRRERENETRPFVAIDSEGGSHGAPYELDGVEIQPHKSFLWGCGDIVGRVEWLYGKTPLGTLEIVQWLEKQAAKNPRAIFISFAFGYDVAQLVADLPYEKAWELQHGKPYIDKNNTDAKSNANRITIWRDYGFQYLKGKSLSIFKIGGYYDNGGKYHLRNSRQIRVFDVFGFFQASFLKSLKAMPGVCSPLEYAIVEKGKSERGNFYHSNLAEIKEYTRHELMLLCRMMQQLREAMAGQKIFPVSWYGAGSLAQALMKRENVRPHVGLTQAKFISEPQQWAHHAFFGGRIELMQQGATKEKLYGYDLASAYPAAAIDLPSMAFGHWTKRLWKEPKGFSLDSLSRLSIVRLRAVFLEGKPFYPLPYRTKSGTIFFPQVVNGCYMVDETRAALRYVSIMGGDIQIEAVWIWTPHSDEKPFAFIKTMFDYRASLSKDDITQIVVKLGINSVYGKLAQSVGQYGKTPAFASPWHAAAITAWTRAKLLDAALSAPSAIVMLATDGIVSTRPLPLRILEKKTLGEWEHAEIPFGGVFIQSGFYAFADAEGKWKSKSRGFRPTNVSGSLAEYMRDTIPDYWKRGETEFAFPYQNYFTLGAATRSERAWQDVGRWSYAVRVLNLQSAGAKRDTAISATERRSRSRKLIATAPTERWRLLVDENGELPLSGVSKPDWLDENFGFRNADEDEQEAIHGRFT